jgi:mannosyltransferase OCH1-like enzyme
MNLPEDFNVHSYQILNNDLKDMDENELINHYLKYGMNENRPYKYTLPKDFDPDIYRIINNDLHHLTNNELIHHYFHHGMYEKREYKYILPDDFDPDVYRIINNDLNHFTSNELIYHYYHYGINENRKYKYNLPKNFDVDLYRRLNSDLCNLNEKDLYNHYFQLGQYENRKYYLPKDFNKYIYKNNYYDHLYNLNDKELEYHYIEYGIVENRVYNKLLYPDEFDWNFYVEINNLDHIHNKNMAYDHCKTNDNLDLYSSKNVLKYYSIHIDQFMVDNDFSNKIDAYHYIVNNNNASFIDNIDLLHLDKIDLPNKNSKKSIIISLCVLPNRILSDEFENCLSLLTNQFISPKYIIINYCNEYKRINKKSYNHNHFLKKISSLKKKYKDSIFFNESIDYGPITKALGIYHLPENIKENIKEDDKIIIVDDDWKYNNLLTYYYELCYSLYHCDMIGIDEQKIITWNNNITIVNYDTIFYNHYSGFMYGWLSFSFRYKYLSKIMDLYRELLKIDENIFFHDDLLFTIFYKHLKLYTCGINLFLPINDNRILDKIDGLRLLDNSDKMRFELEKKILSLYHISNENNSYPIKICESINNENEYIISHFIEKRELLYEINEISYLPHENNYEKYHFDLKYIDSTTFLLTVTIFSDSKSELEENNVEYIDFKCKYNNIDIFMIIHMNNKKKASFFIQTIFYISPLHHINHEEKIIQTYETNKIHENRFYSITTILNKLPEYEYIFFNEMDRIQFIKKNNSNIMPLYEKINNKAYKADLFRVLYLYQNGGIYFDCKNILYNHLGNILCNNEAYAQDYNNNGICNGFIYQKYSNNPIMKKYLLEILYNVLKSKYFEKNELGALEISGPLCFAKCMNVLDNENIKLFCYFENDEWKKSVFIDNHIDKNIIIKISYNGYYEENNYINTDHYSMMWKNRTVYNDMIINYKKINFITAIVWIHLDRSTERKKNMEKLLKKIKIPNYKISAIDGNNINIKKIFQNITLQRDMNQYELACTLSHIKAITFLSKLQGEYFMVCEDDIEIRNIDFIQYNLREIIHNCPTFDILSLHKIYVNTLEEDYTNWNDHLNKFGELYQIGGTACYIISRSGINKITKISTLDSIDKFKFNKLHTFDVADMFLYQNTVTYFYKYNYISVSGLESNIHEDHLIQQNKYEEAEDKYILTNII